MLIERLTDDRVLLSLGLNEEVCLNNVINEVLNGFLVPDFDTRIGISKQEIRGLYEILRTSKSNGATRIELTKRQLLATLNSLREVLRELGTEEFHSRVGVSYQDGERIVRDLDRALASFDLR